MLRLVADSLNYLSRGDCLNDLRATRCLNDLPLLAACSSPLAARRSPLPVAVTYLAHARQANVTL